MLQFFKVSSLHCILFQRRRLRTCNLSAENSTLCCYVKRIKVPLLRALLLGCLIDVRQATLI